MSFLNVLYSDNLYDNQIYCKTIHYNCYLTPVGQGSVHIKQNQRYHEFVTKFLPIFYDKQIYQTFLLHTKVFTVQYITS